MVKDYAGYGAILGVANALKTLMADYDSRLGSPNFDDMALRQAITAVILFGSQYVHCDQNGFRPGLIETGPKDGICEWTGGSSSSRSVSGEIGGRRDKDAPPAEVLSRRRGRRSSHTYLRRDRAGVDQKKLGRRVAAHAHGTEGIKIAVRAGVTSTSSMNHFWTRRRR